MSKMLAFDYGAGSGRAVLGILNESRLELQEIHRFENEPVRIRGSLHWDILRLYLEMERSLTKCMNLHNEISSVGVDTWGVDYGLLDDRGRLLANPYHYRDSRTDQIMEKVFEIMPRDQIYQHTGIQFMQFNTIFQLMAAKQENPAILEQAETLLLIPDLLNYFLTGIKSTEFTNATTTQLLNTFEGNWDQTIIDKLGLPAKIFSRIIQPGTVMGKVSADIPASGTQVISVGSHDTASAVASVPAENGDYVYISCGTWSLMGIESKQPIINGKSLACNFTNEGGIFGTTRFLKNIMGLWIVQECKRFWDRSGKPYTFAELEKAAENARPFASFIDPDSNDFAAPGDMPGRIRSYCKRTGQSVPQTEGEIIRCVLESLALKYRYTLENLESIVGKKLGPLHIVGGGCKDRMLCRFTANACGREAAAGPVEATAIGNITLQAIALGLVADINEGRRLVRESFPPVLYEPANTCEWDGAYDKFLKMPGLRKSE